MQTFKLILSACLLLLLSSYSYAGNRYWVASGNSNWNNTANWSTSSGGAPGASIPGLADIAFFDIGGPGNCILDIPVSIGSLRMQPDYTGIITQSINTLYTSGTATFSGGTFIGGAADITIGGVFTLSGANFTSTSGLLELRSSSAFTSGPFFHNNGTVIYNSIATTGQTISGTSPAFSTLIFNGIGRSCNITSSGSVITNNLSIIGTGTCSINTGTIDVQGDLTISNSAEGGGGSALIQLTGSGDQYINGSAAPGEGALPKLTINKSSGTLYLSNYVVVSNNFTYTTGTVNAGTSTFCFARTSGATITADGSLSLYNIMLKATGTLTLAITAATTLTATGDLTFAGSSNITINTGTINVEGNIALNNTATGGGGSGLINISGSGLQSLDGSSLGMNQNRLPRINIDKPGGVLALAGNISFSQNVTHINGAIDAGTSTAYAVNSLTFSGNFPLYNLVAQRGAAMSLTIAAGNTVTVLNDLTLNNANFYVNINTGTLAVKGSIYITNTSTTASGTGTILINGTGDQSIFSTGVINEGRLPAITISKPSGALTLPALITVIRNWTYSSGNIDATTNNSTVVFANSLTITGTHSLHNINFYGGGSYTYTIAAGTILTASGNMSISGSNNVILNTGRIDLHGNMLLSNTAIGGGGTTEIVFSGNTNQDITGTLTANQSRLPAITINKPAGTLTFPDLITVRGNWTHTAGAIDVTANNATIAFTNSLSITGSHVLNNVIFDGTGNYTYSFATGTVLGINGVMSTIGTGRVLWNTTVAGAQAISAMGDINIDNSSNSGGGTAQVFINGTGTQNITSNVSAGLGRLPYITIIKSAGSLSLNGNISVSRNWTYTSGTVDEGTSTVTFGGNNLTVSSQGMQFNNVAVIANTTTLANQLSLKGNLDINAGVLSPAANSIYIGGNWSNYATAGFTESTSTVLFNGTAIQTITTPGGEQFTNATVNNSGGGIRLQNDIIVSGALSMNNGNIDLNGNNLRSGISAANNGILSYTAGTITGSGSYTRWFRTGVIADGSVNGLFPMGTAAAYRPFSVSAPASGITTGGTITVSYTDASSNTAVSFADGAYTVETRKDLHWTAAAANGLNGGMYNLRVSGTGYGTINNINDVRLTLANSVTGNAGTNSGTTANPVVNRTAISVTNLSNAFYLSSVNAVATTLPVELLSFAASFKNNSVELRWSTSAEINNDYFIVQRSSDALQWKNIQQVEGAGNSTVTTNYTAIDSRDITGIIYYRLMQVDFDGTQKYSAVASVKAGSSLSSVKLYPNPAADYVNISVPYTGKNEVQLYTSNGRLIKTQIITSAGTITWNISHLKADTYLFTIRNKQATETLKLMISK